MFSEKSKKKHYQSDDADDIEEEIKIQDQETDLFVPPPRSHSTAPSPMELTVESDEDFYDEGPEEETESEDESEEGSEKEGGEGNEFGEEERWTEEEQKKNARKKKREEEVGRERFLYR